MAVAPRVASLLALAATVGAWNTTTTQAFTLTPPAPSFRTAAELANAAGVVAGVAGAPWYALHAVVVVRGCTGAAVNGDALEAYPYALHWTRMTVAGSPAAGAVVGNLVVAVAAAAVTYAVAAVAPYALRAAGRPAVQDPYAAVRFPSVCIGVLMMLHQGTAVAAVDLVAGRGGAAAAVAVPLGFLGLAACLVLQGWVVAVALMVVPTTAAVESDAAVADRRALRWCIGRGEWVSARTAPDAAGRWAAVLWEYDEHRAWYAAVHMAVSLALAAAQAVPGAVPDHAGCGMAGVLTGVALVVAFGCLVSLRPHLHQPHTVLDAVTLVCLAVAAFSMAAAHATNGAAADTAAYFCAAASVLALCRACFTVAVWGQGRLGRQARLQAQKLLRARQALLAAELAEGSKPIGTPDMSVSLDLEGSRVDLADPMACRDRGDAELDTDWSTVLASAAVPLSRRQASAADLETCEDLYEFLDDETVTNTAFASCSNSPPAGSAPASSPLRSRSRGLSPSSDGCCDKEKEKPNALPLFLKRSPQRRPIRPTPLDLSPSRTSSFIDGGDAADAPPLVVSTRQKRLAAIGATTPKFREPTSRAGLGRPQTFGSLIDPPASSFALGARGRGRPASPRHGSMRSDSCLCSTPKSTLSPPPFTRSFAGGNRLSAVAAPAPRPARGPPRVPFPP
eukprot:TRINITY_DN9116_c0_g1_i1.p1 TRINITY_DN9116_c0_g1~~TRINITY_DN9116_c0_g1_i1.p1  ORF type:complete len:678 (+),score=173.60 TRINITY_DN9116_c0_g1_i1:89-2122(+)